MQGFPSDAPLPPVTCLYPPADHAVAPKPRSLDTRLSFLLHTTPLQRHCGEAVPHSHRALPGCVLPGAHSPGAPCSAYSFSQGVMVWSQATRPSLNHRAAGQSRQRAGSTWAEHHANSMYHRSVPSTSALLQYGLLRSYAGPPQVATHVLHTTTACQDITALHPAHQ